MIVKLTLAGRNEATYVNFDYVRVMRSEGTFTELIMSDDKYHKIAVTEPPEDIYEMLYPSTPINDDRNCNTVENEVVKQTAPLTEAKKPTAKKTSAKAVEAN